MKIIHVFCRGYKRSSMSFTQTLMKRIFIGSLNKSVTNLKFTKHKHMMKWKVILKKLKHKIPGMLDCCIWKCFHNFRHMDRETYILMSSTISSNIKLISPLVMIEHKAGRRSMFFRNN